MKYILFVILTVHVTSGQNNATYKAGVVEFNLDIGMTGQQKIKQNLQKVTRIINSDETKNVDILVFPELILNDHTVPIPLMKSVGERSPCDSAIVHWVLRDISCAARKSATYIVIDLITKDYAGAVYNTALVFDRKGSIIAKYRKYHLFGETGIIQRPPKPDVITFKTDFDVTFGVFICFDLLYEEPAITLVNKGIKNFVYPTMWISELPYLTAVQIQHGWAYANNVNLLAANANRLETATFGSGIYTGRRGSSIAFIATEPTTKVIIADVPIDPSPIDEIHEDRSDESLEAVTDTDTEYNLLSEDLSTYTIEFLNTSGVQSGEAESNEFHCKYDVSVTDLGEKKDEKTYYYAVATLNGYRSYGSFSNASTAQKICSIIACTKFNERKSCGQEHKSSSEVYRRFRFDRLDLSIDLQMSNMKVIPNTLAMNLKPLQKFDWIDSAIGDVYRVRMKLQEPSSDILTFGIYVRDYHNDILNTQLNEISWGNVNKKPRLH